MRLSPSVDGVDVGNHVARGKLSKEREHSANQHSTRTTKEKPKNLTRIKSVLGIQLQHERNLIELFLYAFNNMSIQWICGGGPGLECPKYSNIYVYMIYFWNLLSESELFHAAGPSRRFRAAYAGPR
jgi:hypothetical protein